MSRTLAAIEADLHIQQPSRAKPTVAQVRAMRALQSRDRAALDRIDTRTIRSLIASQWIDGSTHELTAAGRAAMEMERY